MGQALGVSESYAFSIWRVGDLETLAGWGSALSMLEGLCWSSPSDLLLARSNQIAEPENCLQSPREIPARFEIQRGLFWVCACTVHKLWQHPSCWEPVLGNIFHSAIFSIIWALFYLGLISFS